MRRAPPTVPGTPIKPSIPPRSCFAQNVTVRPRSAEASTCANLPSRTMSGSGETSCRTTHGKSPSPTSKFEPPPKNLCGTWFSSRSRKRLGMLSCLLMRSRSVVPPMPSEVSSARDVPWRSSTSSVASPATILGSLMCMVRRMLRSEENHELVARAADASCPDGQNGITGTRLLEQKADAFLHRAEIVNVFVAGFADGVAERFAGHAGDGRFAGGVDVGQYEDVGLVECTAKIIPEMLRARVAMRLKEHQQPIEFAAAGRFQRGANLDGVMTIVINDGDVIHDALDVKTAAHSGKFGKAFADQVGCNVQIERHGSRGRSVAHIVHARRMSQLEETEIITFIGKAEFAVEPLQLYVADDQVGLARRSISDDRPLHARNYGLHVGLVSTQDCGAVKRHAVHELNERVLNVLERGVLVQVFAVNRSHHGDDRRKHQEAAIALVGFHDKIFAFAQPGGGACLIHSPPDDKRRVEMCCGQHRGDH